MLWNLVFLLIASGIAMFTVHLVRQPAVPQVALRRPPARARTARAAAPKAALAPMQWDGAVAAPAPLDELALSARLRDRYISARFPGLVASSADLARVDHVVRCARMCFEEERYGQAHELLDMAIEQSPLDEALRLAQIEIAFLQRSRGRFVLLATLFRAALPQSRNWAEIARLGRAVAPDDPQFAAGPGSHPREHYGPWPDLPNWIQASWDLTADVLAADFHRAMVRGTAANTRTDQRIAIGA